MAAALTAETSDAICVFSALVKLAWLIDCLARVMVTRSDMGGGPPRDEARVDDGRGTGGGQGGRWGRKALDGGGGGGSTERRRIYAERSGHDRGRTISRADRSA